MQADKRIPCLNLALKQLEYKGKIGNGQGMGRDWAGIRRGLVWDQAGEYAKRPRVDAEKQEEKLDNCITKPIYWLDVRLVSAAESSRDMRA